MDAGPAVFKTAGGRPQTSVQVHVCAPTSAASGNDSQMTAKSPKAGTRRAAPRLVDLPDASIASRGFLNRLRYMPRASPIYAGSEVPAEGLVNGV